jgi:choline-glycine betaine transporter
MKDIKLDKIWKKILYVLTWITFIFAGFTGAGIIIWFVVLGLATYGKDTDNNTEKKKNVLNKTYQKFIYIYGIMMLTLMFIFGFLEGYGLL